MPTNQTWHQAHPFPSKATPAARLEWHKAHQEACGCQDIPEHLETDLVEKLTQKQLKKPHPLDSHLDCD